MLVDKSHRVMDTIQDLTETLSKNETFSAIQKPSQNHQRPINHSEGRGETVGSRQGPANRHGGQDEHVHDHQKSANLPEERGEPVHDHQGPVNHPGIQNPGFPDQHRSLENTKPGAPVILITMMTSLVDWGPKNSHLPVHTDQPGTHCDCQCRQKICQVAQHDLHVGRVRHVGDEVQVVRGFRRARARTC